MTEKEPADPQTQFLSFATALKDSSNREGGWRQILVASILFVILAYFEWVKRTQAKEIAQLKFDRDSTQEKLRRDLSDGNLLVLDEQVKERKLRLLELNQKIQNAESLFDQRRQALEKASAKDLNAYFDS